MSTSYKTIQRKRRHARVRAKVCGIQKKPRLAVFRSNKAIYAQLIDDISGKTLASASSIKAKGKLSDSAKEVGKELAKAAKVKKISECVFDRGGYLYHGRIKALADAAREGGLKF